MCAYSRAVFASIAVLLGLFSYSASAELIYSNSSTSYYSFGADRYVEFLDYGRSQGGQVTSFTIGYYADNSNTVSVRVRFYKYTDSYNIPGTHVRTLTLSMPGVTQGGVTTYTHTVPEISKFSLPSGDFGYSVEFLSYNGEPLLAHGGEGNENVLMYFDDFLDIWRGIYFDDNGVPWAGLYMKIYATEPASCDFHGYVYEDINEDGQKDAGDRPLQGWTIFADYDDDRELDGNEPYDISASDGSYNLPEVDIQEYDALCQVTPGGWKPVNPEDGFYQIWVSDNGSYNLDFGNKEVGVADICGYKFDDLNADGIWDTQEPVLPGWMIFIDENGDGLWQSGEPNAITDPNGFYIFSELEAPATYTVAEQMLDGWYQTFPGGSETYEVAVEPNDILCGYDFGNTTQPQEQTVTISGRITLSDGRGLEGVTVAAAHINPVIGGKSTYNPPSGYNYDSTLSDGNGYYQLIVPLDCSCSLMASKIGWEFIENCGYSFIATDQICDITAYWTYSGGLGTEGSPLRISDCYDLIDIGEHPEDWSKHFILTADIDIADYDFTSALIAPDTETSDGHQGLLFTGVFDGDGYIISNLDIYSLNDDIDCIGLFGGVDDNSLIKNLKLVDSRVSRLYAENVGALVGLQNGGTILNCHIIKGTVVGKNSVGGLVGKVQGSVVECSSSAEVIGGIQLGGFAGLVRNGTVLRCAVYKTSVRGINIPGGVPDYTEGVGGFVGQNTGVINDCYSWADVVNDNYYIGGFAGSDETGMIERCYSTGFLLSMWTYGFSAPGLVYLCDFNSFELCPGCFWDIETTGASESYGGTGLTTEQMHSMDNFVNAGWDFENTWRMCDGFNYPHLQWEERIAGDITCPDGVGMEDFYQLAAQWQMTKLSGDFLPDGIVNLDDWCMLTSAWNSELGEADYDPGCDISGEIADGAINIDDLAVFIGQWLSEGLYSADVCPEQGDDVVNNDDLAVISENWLQGR